MSETIETVRLLDVGPRPRRWTVDPTPAKVTARAPMPSVQFIGILERAIDFVTILAVIVATFPSLKLYALHFQLVQADVLWTANRASLLTALLIAGLYMMCLQSVGIYSLSGGLLRIRETACLLRAVVTGSVLLELYALLSQNACDVVSLTGVSALLFFCLLLQKSLLGTYLSRLEIKASSQRRVLLYGDPGRTQHLQEAIGRSTRLRMRIVALVDASRAVAAEMGSGVNNGLSLTLLQQQHIDTIVVAQPQQSEAVSTELRSLAFEAGIPIYFLADFAEGSRAQMDCLELDGHFLFGLYGTREAGVLQSAAKRAFDIVSSFSLLFLTAFPLVIAALLVKFTSEGPVFFRQTRIGEHGKPFTIFKFRTMHQAACVDSVSPSTSLDPRITRVGRFLRKSSIDELPQLFNVLRGEMAMVGPRPEMPFIVADYKEIHRARLSVKPGLTGLWQISEHRAKPIHENIEYDLYYLRYRSISFDLAIMLHTLVFAVRGI